MHRPVNCHKITHRTNGHWILTCIFVLFSIPNLLFLSPISLISPSPPNKYLPSSYSSCMCCLPLSHCLDWAPRALLYPPSGHTCMNVQTHCRQDISSLPADSKCKSPGLLHNQHLTSVQMCCSAHWGVWPVNVHGAGTQVPCWQKITSSQHLQEVRSSHGS